MPPTRLACLDVGRGRPVLLVHGFPFNRAMWSAQVEALRGSCRVIAPDLRGFGASAFDGQAPTVWTMEQHADDLAELLDALAVSEPVVYVGFSMGGYVAWPFFRRHRRRMAALALCDTRAVADTPEGAQGRRALAQRVLLEGAQPVVDAMLPKLLAPATLAGRPEIVAAVRAMMQAAPPEAIAAALHGMSVRSDATQLLGGIDLPALAIVGEHDAISPPAEMRALAAAMPDALTVLVPGAGHMTTHENPAAVDAALLAFVG